MPWQCSFKKLYFFAPIMPKIMLAQSAKAYTGCLGASNTILIGADQKETFEFCPPTEDTYLPSGDFELDFRVGLSSWIFELGSRVGFSSSTITNIDIDYIINCISCLITNNCVIFFVTLYSRRFST